MANTSSSVTTSEASFIEESATTNQPFQGNFVTDISLVSSRPVKRPRLESSASVQVASLVAAQATARALDSIARFEDKEFEKYMDAFLIAPPSGDGALPSFLEAELAPASAPALRTSSGSGAPKPTKRPAAALQPLRRNAPATGSLARPAGPAAFAAFKRCLSRLALHN